MKNARLNQEETYIKNTKNLILKIYIIYMRATLDRLDFSIYNEKLRNDADSYPKNTSFLGVGGYKYIKY